jgi:hypothetical protein
MGVQVAPSRPSVSWGLLTGGTSISWRRHRVCRLTSTDQRVPPLGGWAGPGPWAAPGGAPGTLLGPEGSGELLLAFSFHGRDRHRCPLGPPVVVGWLGPGSGHTASQGVGVGAARIGSPPVC